MKFLKFLMQYRFSHYDIIWLYVTFYLFLNHRFLEGLLAFFVGILSSVWIELWIKNNDNTTKDRFWQGAANAGLKIEAIKLHRQQYGSTLKEAKDVVDAYIQKN